MCQALPFWFALTGCDFVSMFGGRGKKTAWYVWQKYPKVTEVLKRQNIFPQFINQARSSEAINFISNKRVICSN